MNITYYYSDPPTEAPSVLLSQRPSSNYVLTINTPLHVPYYSASYTSSATVNTVPYTFTTCFAGELYIADCNSVRCQSGINDQYIRLYSNGLEVASDDDSCTELCSIINYRIMSATCQTYTLQQGCYSNRGCSGNFTISFTSFPSQTPIIISTVTPRTSSTVAPTVSPIVTPTTSSTVAPTASPIVAPTTSSTLTPSIISTVAVSTSPIVDTTTRSSVAPTALSYNQCPMFTASNTNSALINYQTCIFFACPGTSATINTCDSSRSYSCVGDTYLRLYDGAGFSVISNDDMGGVCGLCSSFFYTFTQPCQYYTLHEGCYSSSSCSGTVHITSNVAITIGIAYHTSNIMISVTYTAFKQLHLPVHQSVGCQPVFLPTVLPTSLPSSR